MSRHLLQKIWRLPRLAVKRFVTMLLRVLLLMNRPARLARSGFVLPTTALLVLMVLLTATALTYRALTRSDMAMTQREQQVIVNAATPAIDRAKAKIEFLFQNDPRFPSGVPASDVLADLMANERQASIDDTTKSWAGYTTQVALLNDQDPYTLPDEVRVNINPAGGYTNAGQLDNAWMYRTDIDGDGTVEDSEIIVYSILVDDVGPEAIDPAAAAAVALQDPDDEAKAKALVTRTGPQATTQSTAACGGAIAEGGWQIVQAGNNSTLQKNFQVNVFVANANDVNRTFETMEFQQSRIAARSSKWGAWFRYDLEIHPGEDFNWNGAMHTDGNLVLWGDIDSYLVSSPKSCVYNRASSEITLGEFDNDQDNDVNIYQASSDANSPPDFQGQVMAAKTDGNSWGSGDMEMHIFDGVGVAPITNKPIDETNDSVDSLNSKPSDVAMNPLVLFAQDRATHVATGTASSPLWRRATAWDNTAANGNPFRQVDKERIYNDQTAKPFVDDFFRADNRLGPKPRYDDSGTLDVTVDNDGTNALRSGVEISASGLDATLQDQLTNPTEGLDGYWERQAIRRGLRVIVGQRLELGNSNGWGFNPSTGNFVASQEALYPHTATAFDNTGINTGIHGGPHERLHRKALHDNLAAVQSMAVYHYQGGGTNGMADDGEFPLACYALTAHPGTQQTIINSRTFGTWDDGTIKTDFFNGNGTNGWEFSFPDTFDDPTGFADEIVIGQPLGDALRNLANFAGDPRGGAPSFPAVQDTFPHPYPDLSMWGDFSVLRRILAKYDASSLSAEDKYEDLLSSADRATLHTAACTLSMLAYNIQKDTGEFLADLNALDAAFGNVQSEATQLRNEFGDLIAAVRPDLKTGNATNYDATLWPASKNPQTTGISIPGCVEDAAYRSQYGRLKCDLDVYLGGFSLDEMIQVFESSRPAGEQPEDTAEIVALLREMAATLKRVSALTRDRELGFKPGNPSFSSIPGYTQNVVWDSETGLNSPISIPGLSNAAGPQAFTTSCNPNIFQRTATGSSSNQQAIQNVGAFRVSLALVVCSEIEQYPTKYPSLFYLFPTTSHVHAGSVTDGNNQPSAEEYIADSYVTRTDVNGATTLLYKRIGSDSLTGLNVIAAAPKSADMTDWVVPHTDPASGTLTDPDENTSTTRQTFRIAIGSNIANVAFLDKGVFNGREMLNTRVLDIDLDALITQRPYSGADYWLSADLDNDARGVVYAFREDAVREDEIVRPKNSGATFTPAYCMQVNKTNNFVFRLEREAECLMNANPASPQDPPLTIDGISLKPVDFVPDPERRPHGFRLRTASRNPADFSGGNPAAAGARMVGMTFVTDNSVYIMGNFNPHSENPTGILSGNDLNTANVLEEFTQKILGTNYSNFYTRTTLNTGSFAKLTVDHWRPVEILSDAITVLSRNFVDGAVEDTFTGTTPSSYTNQTRPNSTNATYVGIDKWVHSTQGNNGTPVWVDRNGVFYYLNSGAPTAYYAYFDESTATDNHKNWRSITEGKQLQNSTEDTYINATFVSGITPKRANQGYGGLHNFPRFNENWNSDLFIQGSFIQLNFSTASTGPYEQEGLEPGTLPLGSEEIDYYDPPARRWGYDVGLLYVPPAPAAERFVDIASPRSEYYRELPADDPYIVNLRCAQGDVNGDGTVENIFPAEIRGTCPS